MRHNATYTFLFAAAVCIVCGVLVSTSAVSLKDLQEKNAKLDKMRNVLMVAGLARGDEKLSGEEIHKRFQAIKPVVIDLATGEPTPTTYERSDFNAVPRAVVVGEAMIAFVLADVLQEKLGGDSLAEQTPRFQNLRRAHLDDLPMDDQPWRFGFE